MALQKQHFNEEYRTGEIDLIENFYAPCLQASNRYDRAVGYFRSSVFVLIGRELLSFAKNGGKVRLVCSPSLTVEDAEAIQSGYTSRESVIEKSIHRELDDLLGNRALIKNTEALATLITLNVIDVRIAFLPGAKGIYHEKVGLFYDGEGNTIGFKGSVNETWNGWHERGNYETLDVFCNWLGGRDQRQVERNQVYFENLWSGNLKDLRIETFSSGLKDKLKLVSKGSIDDIDPDELTDFFNVGHLYALKNPLQNNPNSKRTPLPHQAQAIENWKNCGCKGILEHATGSGKTFTALTIIKEHLDKGGVSIVLVPDRLLHKQWAIELKQEIPDVTLLKAGDGFTKWRKKGRLKSFTQPSPELGKRVVLATMPTARMDDFRKGIYSGSHLLVVVDEVHEIGSLENSKALEIEASSRLGLSATPRRYGDPEGTSKIFSYFNGIIDPPFTLEDAIHSGRLVEYEYHPHAIHLTAAESEAWETATKEISREYAKSKKDDGGNVIPTPRLKNLLIQRSRIAKKAQAKVPYAIKTIKDNYIKGESWLIYCEDQHQLQEVLLELRNIGENPCEYHTNMTGDPEASLEWFKRFGGIMVSIRCLDQGIDIPKISHAIILASSQNPRQFIQRRGRVLRTCPGKYSAVIHDAIVVPVDLDEEPGQLSLLKSELQRSIQFSETALNRSGANKLITIAINLGVDPHEVGIYDTDGIEEIGEKNDQ